MTDMQIRISQAEGIIIINVSIKIDVKICEEAFKEVIVFATIKAILNAIEDLNMYNYCFKPMGYDVVKILVTQKKLETNITRDEAIRMLEESLEKGLYIININL